MQAPAATNQYAFSIVIVSLNGSEVIVRCLDSLRAQDYPGPIETIVVDNGSTDSLAQIVRDQYPEVRLIQSPVNLGFAGGNNLGLRAASGDILILLNDDTEARPDWLSSLARAAASHRRWGVLGCKLLYPDGKTIQHAGGYLEPNGQTQHFGYEAPDDGSFDQVRRCDYVTGAALAIRRKVFNKLGPLDAGYFPIYFEETDYCWQVRRIGYEVLYIPDAVVLHHESRTQARFSYKFLTRYNRHRIRFLLKCFSKAQLRSALVAELRWWLRPPCKGTAFYLGYLASYLQALPQVPGHLRARFPFHRRLEKIASEFPTAKREA